MLINFGGYIETKTIDNNAKEVFDKAIKGLTGIGYTPFAYATQVVNGTMYRFLCSAKTLTQTPAYY